MDIKQLRLDLIEAMASQPDGIDGYAKKIEVSGPTLRKFIASEGAPDFRTLMKIKKFINKQRENDVK